MQDKKGVPCGRTEKADDWTRLFEQYGQDRTAWIGADGIYSLALDGTDAMGSAHEHTRTFFIFSDTLIGTTGADGKNAVWEAMPNHSAALLDGKKPDRTKRQLIWGAGGVCPLGKTELDDEKKKNLVGKRKWFTDGLVHRDRLYLFCYTPVGLGNVSVDMAAFPIRNGTVDFAAYTLTEAIPSLSLLDENGKLLIDYGYGVLVNTKEAGALNPDGYIYLYGGGPGCRGYVSRIRAEDFPDFSALRYFDGSGWSENIADSAQILTGVSREYSVTPIPCGPMKGKYIAVYMQDCISGNIACAVGETPYGPFGEGIVCYRAPEAGEAVTDAHGKEDRMYTYNAKAHPHLSEGSCLLISYNTNVWGGFNTPYCYHPRFITLDLETI